MTVMSRRDLRWREAPAALRMFHQYAPGPRLPQLTVAEWQQVERPCRCDAGADRTGRDGFPLPPFPPPARPPAVPAAWLVSKRATASGHASDNSPDGYAVSALQLLLSVSPPPPLAPHGPGHRAATFASHRLDTRGAGTRGRRFCHGLGPWQSVSVIGCCWPAGFMANRTAGRWPRVHEDRACRRAVAEWESGYTSQHRHSPA